MNRADAIQRALSMHPDVPGVGRLCQELLADISGLAITREVPAQIALWGSNSVGNCGNPWGRRGKPA